MADSPRVSMLWEWIDAEFALNTRFGFADVDSAVSWVRGVLQDNWAIAVDDCERLVMSDGNLLAWIVSDGRRLIAKWSVVPRLFRRLAETTTLTMWLHASGLPVAAPIPVRDGRLRVELDNASLAVIPVIEGDLLDVGDPGHVAEAGHVLALLHAAMAAYPHVIGGGPSTPQQQLVHNDFRSANVLHDGAGITAVLDFESVTYRSRVADLAQATVMLGTRYHDWAPTDELVRESFVSAYEERSPLDEAERAQLQTRMDEVMRGLGWASENDGSA